MLNCLRLEEFLFIFVCVSVSVRMSLNTWRLRRLSGIGLCLPPCLNRVSCLLCHMPDQLARKLPGTLLSPPPILLKECSAYRHVLSYMAVCGCWISESRSSCLYGKCFYSQSHCLLSFLPCARLVTGSRVTIVRSPLLWRFSNHQRERSTKIEFLNRALSIVTETQKVEEEVDSWLNSSFRFFFPPIDQMNF